MSGEEFSGPVFKILPLVQPDQEDLIDKDKIRSLTSVGLNGAPHEDRAVAWLVLFNIYPQHAREWNEKREYLVNTYTEYVRFVELENWTSTSLPVHCLKDKFDVSDKKLMDLIHKDIVRTSKHIYSLPVEQLEGEPDDGSSLVLYTVHLRRLERILYIFGFLNKTVGYMQGFNEIVMPIYSVYINAKGLFSSEIEIESMTFHSFHYLIFQTTICDLFMLNDKPEIIVNKLSGFKMVMARHLPKAYHHLEKLDIQPILYAFKWIGLLFCQNFEIPFLHEIWDCLLSHYEHIVEYAYYIAVAQLETIEARIVGKDFSVTIETIQNISINEIGYVLRLAHDWWEDDHKQTKGFFRNLF